MQRYTPMNYHRVLIIGGCLASLAVLAQPASGQRRAPGDVDPSGRVLAKVIAGMTESETLSRPVSGLRVLVVGESGDSLTIRTDDAGIATAWVRPGPYRFVSLDSVTWQGRSYGWDIGLRIDPGTGPIIFSQATATSSTVEAPPSVPAVVPGEPAARGPRTGPSPSRLRLFTDCQATSCDHDYFRDEIRFVDHVRDRQEAAVHLLITSESTGGGGTAYTLNFIGQGELSGAVDTLRYTAAASSTSDEKRSGLARTMKIGLMRYVARTPTADQLQITYKAAAVGRGARAADVADPWNLWVISIYLSGDVSGEESQRFTSLRTSTSANRISESWKSRLRVYANYDESRYTLSDNSTSKSLTRSYGATQLLVKSLGQHWSIGERSKLLSSTFVNQKLYLRFAPTIEFNFFPYSESTRRLLSVQYAVGVNSFQYEDTTIFDKLSESRPHNALMVALGLKQPWGSASTSLEGGAYLDDFKKYSAVSYTELDLRLFKGFSVNLYTGLSLVRDQLYLAKGKLTDEQILLRRRKLASKYSYFGGIGLSYSFGSIFNNVVNPRFEGIDGNTAFF